MASSGYLMPRLCCLVIIRNIFLKCDWDLPRCRSNPWLPHLFTMVSGNSVLSFFVLKDYCCVLFPLLVFWLNSPTFLVSPHKPYFLDLWLFSLFSSEFFQIDPNIPCSAELKVNSVFQLRYNQCFVNWNYCSNWLLVILAWDYRNWMIPSRIESIFFTPFHQLVMFTYKGNFVFNSKVQKLHLTLLYQAT